MTGQPPAPGAPPSPAASSISWPTSACTRASSSGPGYGLVTAWLLLLVYTSFAAGVYAATADIAQTLLATVGIHIGWLWLALAGAALAIALAYLSIGFSSLVILACEAAAIALITVVAIAVLAAGGYHHHGLTAAPFGPHGVPLTVLALGVTAAFGQFSGFEGAAALGEETRDRSLLKSQAARGRVWQGWRVSRIFGHAGL